VAMIPAQRELMKRMADKPFTILGINSDENRSVLKQRLVDERISWPNICDGSTDGEIDATWNIRSWPTGYLIDHKGIIRGAFHVSEEDLEQSVKQLNDWIDKIPK
jgi:hypothetical protein